MSSLISGSGTCVVDVSAGSDSHACVSSNPYAVHLGFFSGPLDLFLHLVRQKEVQIEDVEMAIVAEQYLRVVAHSALIDLESASEYLVIAATLLAIKSKELLPSDEKNDSELGAEDLGEAFYEELRERLKEYRLTQLRAQTLVGVSQLGVDVFVRKDRGGVPTAPTDIEEGQDPLTLAQGFFRLLKRIGASMRTIKIHLEPISIVSYMMKVVDKARCLMDGRRPTSFKDIFVSLYRDETARDGVPKDETRRSVIIGSFIAILELAKRGMVSIVKSPGSLTFAIEVMERDGKSKDDFVALSPGIESEWGVSVDTENIDSMEKQEAVGW